MPISIKKLNVYKFLKYFSKYLNEMFVPFFVFETTNSLALTLFYLVLTSIFYITFNLLLKKAIIKNLNVVMIFSIFEFILFDFIIISTGINIYLYTVLAALFSGLDNMLAYSTMEYLYNKTKDSENVKNIRNTFIVEIVALTLAPFIGGVLVQYFGKICNALVGIIICVVAVIYILPSLNKHRKIQEQITFEDDTIKNLDLEKSQNQEKILENKQKIDENNEKIDKIPEVYSKRKFKNLLKYQKFILISALFLMALVGVMNRLESAYTIYLKILNINYLETGALNALITLGQIVFAIITYFFQLKQKDTLLLFITSIAMCGVWCCKSFLVDGFSLYFFSIMNGLIYPFLYQPIKYLYVSALKKYAQPHSIFYMEEITRQIGAMVSSLVGLIFVFLGTDALKIMFTVSAISYLLIPFISIITNKINDKHSIYEKVEYDKNLENMK